MISSTHRSCYYLSFVFAMACCLLVSAASAATTVHDVVTTPDGTTTTATTATRRYQQSSSLSKNETHKSRMPEDRDAGTPTPTTSSSENPSDNIVGYPVSRYSADRRLVDIVDTVRPEHVASENPLGVSADEWKARTELAAAYRALYLLGLERSSYGSDQAAQCLMLRIDDTDTDEIVFLMADWGIWFEEVTASNLLKFTVDGDVFQKDGQRISPGSPLISNIGCIPVAKAIFESRPDVNMIVHIHPYAVMAVGGLEWGLLPLSQAAFFLWGQVSREDYDFSYESNFEETLQQGFAEGQRAMLLNHHGMYAVGRDVAEGLFEFLCVLGVVDVLLRRRALSKCLFRRSYPV